MSFTVDGVTFTPDYRAKEKRLYQIIAAKDDEIKALWTHVNDLQAAHLLKDEDLGRLSAELRALRAKERRRATKRKKGREQPVD